MKQRGLGMIFQRGAIWWVQYYFRGKRYRETSGSTAQKDAVRLLRARQAEMGQGRLRGPELEKTTFADLVQMMRDEYAANQRRSVKRLNTSLKALEPAFGHLRACDITLDRLNRYVADRLAVGIAPATAKLELTHLHKAFRLAERAGKAICPPFPVISVQNARKGFFERGDFEAVRSHLPGTYRGVATFAFLSGWRVPSEVLRLQWSQVDFQAGIVRLEPGTTKNDEGRTLPFAVLPELAQLLRSHWDEALATELQTGQQVPWVFFWNDRGVMKPIHVKAFYRRWQAACKRAGVPERIPHDFRRTAVRNFERAGVPRSVAMKLTGHKTEAVYRRYAIVSEADLTEGLKKLARLQETLREKMQPCGTPTEFSHSLATISGRNMQFSPENLAEGARFELADRLPHLRFSRPARSATPSPLHTRPETRSCERFYLLKSSHIGLQDGWDSDRTVRLLIIFENGDQRAPDSQPGAVQCMNKLRLRIFFAGLRAPTNARAARLKCLKIAAGRDLAKGLLRREPDLNVVRFRGREAHVAGAEREDSIV